MRKTLYLVLAIFACSVQTAVTEEFNNRPKKEQFAVTDLLSKPLELLLAPVFGREFPPLTIDLPQDTPSDVGEFAVTPSGYRQRVVDYPGNVTVITEKDIARSNARYVYEILRREAGIYVSDYTHAGKTVTVDMRGFGETASRNVLVMVDGRRINQIDISGIDWKQIPLKSVERIEILRGSGSVLYGDNAAAGVINILTKRGQKGHSFSGGADFGSYKYRNFYSMLNGEEDFASYNLTWNHEETDGYRLNGNYYGYDLLGAITLFPSEYLDIDISAGYHKDWYGLPSGLRRTEIDSLGYRGSRTPNDRVKTESSFFKVSPGISFSGGGMDHLLSLDLWGQKKRVNMINWAEFPAWGIPWYPSWDTSVIDSLGGSFKYRNVFISDELHNTLTIGVDLFSASNDLLTVTPQWGTLNQLKIDKKTLGVYISDSLAVSERIIFTSGFRQEWAGYSFDQKRGAGMVTDASLMESRSPKAEAFEAGVNYKYLRDGTVYGRFSRSYRFPATDEFYSRWTGLDPDIKHQKSDIWEVGIKDNNLRYFQPTVNMVWMTTHNEIFYDPTFGAFGRNSNYDRTERFAVETAALSNISDWLDMYFNYTYMESRFSGGVFCGNKVPMVPEHKISWGINAIFEKFMELNFNSEYVSGQYSINDQMNRMPKLKPRFVCNGKATFKYANLEIFMGINNIFDSRYSEIAVSDVGGTVTDLHPAPGRNYIFGISQRF